MNSRGSILWNNHWERLEKLQTSNTGKSNRGEDIPGKFLLGKYENNILNLTFNGRKVTICRNCKKLSSEFKQQRLSSTREDGSTFARWLHHPPTELNATRVNLFHTSTHMAIGTTERLLKILHSVFHYDFWALELFSVSSNKQAVAARLWIYTGLLSVKYSIYTVVDTITHTLTLVRPYVCVCVCV